MEKKDEVAKEEISHNNEEEEFEEEDEEKEKTDKIDNKEKTEINKESHEENNNENNQLVNENNKINEEGKRIINQTDEGNKEENINNTNTKEKIIKNEENSAKIEEKKEMSEKMEKAEEQNKNKEDISKGVAIKEKEEGQKKEEKVKEKEMEEEDIGEEQKESASTYILKYTRKSNEPRESSYDKELIKSKNCSFMIQFKLFQGKKNKYLLIYCHEIAALYFDEIYEKKYTLNDLYKENKHFRIYDDIEEAKSTIDEIINNNTKNSKKVFINIQDDTFELHLKMIFFDKETEIIFSIPKKKIDDKERIRLLPEFLTEIQIKINTLEEDNKKLRNENRTLSESDLLGSEPKFGGEEEYDYIGSKTNKSVNIKRFKSGNEKGLKKKNAKK